MSIWYKIEGTLDHHVNARIRGKTPRFYYWDFINLPATPPTYLQW